MQFLNGPLAALPAQKRRSEKALEYENAAPVVHGWGSGRFEGIHRAPALIPFFGMDEYNGSGARSCKIKAELSIAVGQTCDGWKAAGVRSVLGRTNQKGSSDGA